MTRFLLSPCRLLTIFFISAILCGGLNLNLSADTGDYLQWGTAGGGGGGIWDDGTANWWNGSANVPWEAGGHALFAGAGGVVEIAGAQSIRALRFEGEGYRLNGDSLTAPDGELLIAALTDARIDAPGGTSLNRLTFRKIGPGTLTLGTQGYQSSFAPQNVFVEEGVVRLLSPYTGTGLHTLAEDGELLLAIGSGSLPNLQVGALAGSGLVRPEPWADDVRLVIRDSGSFEGVLTDGEGTVLSVGISWGTQELRGANTWTGTTGVGTGTLSLAGGGTVQSNDFTVVGGMLLLDNSEQAVSHRLPQMASVDLQNGRFHLRGNSTADVSENLDLLRLAGVSTVRTEKPGSGETVLVIERLEREPLSIANFEGEGTVRLEDAEERGLLPWAVWNGTHWVEIGGDGTLGKFDSGFEIHRRTLVGLGRVERSAG